MRQGAAVSAPFAVPRSQHVLIISLVLALHAAALLWVRSIAAEGPGTQPLIVELQSIDVTDAAPDAPSPEPAAGAPDSLPAAPLGQTPELPDFLRKQQAISQTPPVDAAASAMPVPTQPVKSPSDAETENAADHTADAAAPPDAAPQVPPFATAPALPHELADAKETYTAPPIPAPSPAPPANPPVRDADKPTPPASPAEPTQPVAPAVPPVVAQSTDAPPQQPAVPPPPIGAAAVQPNFLKPPQPVPDQPAVVEADQSTPAPPAEPQAELPPPREDDSTAVVAAASPPPEPSHPMPNMMTAPPLQLPSLPPAPPPIEAAKPDKTSVPVPANPPVIAAPAPAAAKAPPPAAQVMKPPPAKAARQQPPRNPAAKAAAKPSRQIADGAKAGSGGKSGSRGGSGSASGQGRRAGGGGLSRASYGALVVAQIQSRKFYPASARSRGATGTVGFVFTIGGSGRTASFRITRSSGSSALDGAAAQIVRGLHLPPPPGGSFSAASSLNFSFN